MKYKLIYVSAIDNTLKIHEYTDISILLYDLSRYKINTDNVQRWIQYPSNGDVLQINANLILIALDS